MYENVLKQIGLSEKQAKVYLACLELGQAKVPAISRKAGIKRTTTYGLIEELAKLGLVSAIKKNKQILYKAQPPHLLLDILDQRRKLLVNSLPELEDLFESHNVRPEIIFYEGKNGIKEIYKDVLNCTSKKIYQTVNAKAHAEMLGDDFINDYIKKRVAKGITTYDIHPKSGDIYTNVRGRQNLQLKRYVKYLPPDLFSASMIMLYDNKVAMVSSSKENFGFIIQSKEFTNTIKAFFNLVWKLGSNEPDVD